MTLSNENSDKRAAFRRRVRLPATIIGSTVHGGSFSEETTIKNLSSQGALFSFNTPLRVGHKLEVNMDLQYMNFGLKASVVRTISRADGFDVAVSFSTDQPMLS